MQHQDLGTLALSSHSDASVEDRLERRRLGRNWCHYSLLRRRNPCILLHLRPAMGILDGIRPRMGCDLALCRWPMVELFRWDRLCAVGLVRDCFTARNNRANRASDPVEAEMDDVLLLLPRLQVCGPEVPRSKNNKADILKRCRCWYCEDILVGAAWASPGYLLDRSQSPHLVHRGNAASDRLRLRTIDPIVVHICAPTHAQPESSIQTAQ